jgi:hypothetical protein
MKKDTSLNNLKLTVPASTSPRNNTIRVPTVSETGNGTNDGNIWLARIAKTLRQREDMPNGAQDWKRYYEWFEGDQWNERGLEVGGLSSDNARNTATVNITGSIAQTFVPFLINGEIRFKLTPRKMIDTKSAEIQQALLNYEWSKNEMTSECKAIVQDVVIIGHGIGKTGYIIELDETRKKSDGSINYKDYIKKDNPYIERVDPINFLFDLTAKDGTLRTARWCAERFFTPYADVVANKDYKTEVLAMINTGAYTFDITSGFSFNDAAAQNLGNYGSELTQITPEDQLVPLWEVWDKKYRKRYVYAQNVPIPLLEEVWPYDYLDGFPYIRCDYIRVPNKPYPMGVMRQVEDQQIQLNRIRTSQFNHIRSHGRKFMAVAGRVLPEHLKDFQDMPDGGVIQVEAPEALIPIQDATMSQDFQIVEARIQSDIEQLTGADALLQGKPLASRTTAGEVSARTNILRLKADDRVSAVERAVTELAIQVLMHLKKFKTLPDVVKIVGLQGEYWKEYTNEEIQAETDVTVEYFSAPKFDPALDRQQKLQILQLAVQAMPAMEKQGDQIDMPALFNWILKGFDLKDAGEFFKKALVVTPPLEEVKQEVKQDQAIAGMNAPQPIPEGIGNPGEGESIEDILMGIQGSGVVGSGELPGI